MPVAARIGDATLPHGPWSGGVLTAGSPDVLINGIPVARIGDSGTPHTHPKDPPHGNVVSAGSGSVLVNGKPIARMGDAMSCGSTIGAGSPNVIVGG